MDRSAFFGAVRTRVFAGSASQPQVDGTEAILDSCIRHNVTDPHHVAHCLAEVYHETGGYMLGIKETVMPSHKDKCPSDETVKARLEAAWKAGKLPWVKAPYWRDGGFGRGPIQLTTWPNYERMGKRLGVDLRHDPDLALDPKIGADIAVVGMSEGMFTEKKLSDYTFPAALDEPPAQHPRRIVNGKDGTDAEISRYHRAFYAALMAAGFGKPDEPAIPAAPANPPAEPVQRDPDPAPQSAPAQTPPNASAVSSGGLAALIIAAVAAAGLWAAGVWDRLTDFLGSIF
jgi:predicted chitinase